MRIRDVEALLFDVFGTVVDWRSGIIRVGKTVSERRDLAIDWAAFADAWREQYGPSIARVRSEERSWQNLDALHRESLAELVESFGLEELTADEKTALIRAWHQLDPWPDVIPGLRRIEPQYLIAPLSNGHVRLLTNLSKRAGLPWDLILSAELAEQYKPDEAVYRTAVDLLDCDPNEVLMVAAHEGDLVGSSEVGLQTAYVHRPNEWGPAPRTACKKPPEEEFAIVADDFLDLADRLNAPSLGERTELF